jgi:FG-GAP-like repeat/S-layer homology domain
VGDFNGDAMPDLAAANYGGNTIGILPGNGDGTFRPAVTFAVGAGTSPVAVVPGDFNADTRLDMFVANENTDNGSVFINTCEAATATPTPATPSPTPPAPTTTATSTSTATPCFISFSDVHPGEYFYEPVRYLYCHGAISGYGDNTFHPYNLATRGQLAKIVVLAEGFPIYTPPTPTFRDVSATDPFYRYVETAYHQGIISGYSCGTGCLEYRPGNNVTRAQLCKIVVLAERWSIYTPPAPTFRDVPASDPFYGYVETAYYHGIISGYACGRVPSGRCLEFRPGNNATRGQICKIVYLAVTAPPMRTRD